jgi:hypothetical protein
MFQTCGSYPVFLDRCLLLKRTFLNKDPRGYAKVITWHGISMLHTTTDMFPWWYFVLLCSFMTYHQICNKNYTTNTTSGAGIVYPSETPALIPSVSSFHVAQYLVFCVVFRRLLFVFLFFFILVIVLSVVPFTASDYSFGIFKCLPWWDTITLFDIFLLVFILVIINPVW